MAAPSYNVFLNHRGPDVKKTFASHLYRALSKYGFRVFLDEPELQQGDSLTLQIQNAVRTASIHVAVFSPHYAESIWCLNELLLMLESGKTIIPVFYHVTPTELRWTRGKYAEALQQLAEKTTYDPQSGTSKSRYDSATIEKWRNALSRVADISGFDLGTCNGKCTENARKGALISLQRKLLYSLIGSDLRIDDEIIETLLKQHLASSEIFIILDDVDHVDQVDALLPEQAIICSDSLILITSRYKNILTASGVEDSSIYKLTGLNEEHSRELFCSHAFNQPYPLSGFESLVDKFSKACGGLPLSLKVFGALHCGQTDPYYWEEQLDKLGRILPSEIKQRLQISFEALDAEEQEIFLDIACFFIGENRDMAVRIWDGSHWKGFQNLEDRCLVEVDSKNVIHMHDHLRDLGRDIAKAPGLVRGTENIDDLLQQPSPIITDVRGIRTVYTYTDDDGHANGRSELSWHRGILQVPVSEGGLLERILTRVHSPNLIWLRWYNFPYSSLPSWIPVKNLRVLEVHGGKWTSLWEGEWQAPLQLRDLQIRGALSNIPNSIGQLKYLERISLNYEGPIIKHNILALPEEFCLLRSLKTLVLSFCPKMKSLPDSFGNLKNLEFIDLSSCYNLRRLPKSFGNLTKLKYLNLAYCSKLTMSSETLGNISTLEHINLANCAKIEVLPLQLTYQRSLKKLYLEETNVKELPNAIGELSDLEVLSVGSPLLDTLPPSLGALKNLKTLNLEHCKELKWLPASIGLLTQLTELSVKNCPISELPSLSDLRNLNRLNLENCKELKWLPASVGLLTQLTNLTVWKCPIRKLPSLSLKLETLSLYHCKELKCLPASVGLLTRLVVHGCPISELPSLPDWRNLKMLFLSDCKELKCLPASVGPLTLLSVNGCPISELPSLQDLRNLEILSLEDCKELKCLPASVGLLTKLTKLSVKTCPISELPSLPDLRNLKTLSLEDCKELKCLPASVGLLTQLTELSVKTCPISELPSLPDLRNLKTLYLEDCKLLKCLPASVGLLTQLRVTSCPISELPSLLNLSNLKTLKLSYCKELKCLAAAGLARLQTLDITECKEVEELPNMEALVSLERLLANGCVKLKSIQRLVQRTKLRELQVGGYSDLEGLLGVEHLRSLEKLHAQECVKLKSLRGLAQSTELRQLYVSECCELEDLEGVEHLRSLEKLEAFKCAKLKSIKELAQLTDLRYLNVSECCELEDLEGVEQLRSLESLHASKCVKLRSIKRLAQLTELLFLNVSECSELEDLEGVEHLRSLKYLQASKCVKLRSIKRLAQLKKLWSLNVSECSELEGLEGIEHCTRLRHLNASGCPKLQWGGGVVEQLHERLKEELVLKCKDSSA